MDALIGRNNAGYGRCAGSKVSSGGSDRSMGNDFLRDFLGLWLGGTKSLISDGHKPRGAR